MAVSNQLQAVPLGRTPAEVTPARINEHPQGLTRRVATGLLETFFRRPVVYLLPLLLLLAFGVYTAMNAEDEYQSVGVLHASSGSLLSELTGDTPSFGYERPSTVTARTINDMMGTTAFLNDVVAGADLAPAIEAGMLTEDDIRQAVTARPHGDNLVAVVAVTTDPNRSQVLADATLGAFVRYVVTNDILDATVRIDTYETLRDQDLAAYEAARAELDQYLTDHPWSGDPNLRPIDQQLQIGLLQESVSRADEIYRASDDAVDSAQIAADVAETVVERQLRIVDEPEVAGTPLAGMRAAAMTVGMFFILGLVLSAALVVLATVMDRTMRTPGDVEAKFGVDAIAVLPTARR